LASFSQAKALGAVGSILVLLAGVPSVGVLAGIVGFILILVAINEISDILNDRAIFNNALLAIGLAVVGIVAGALVVFGGFLNFVALHHLTFANLGSSFNPSSVPVGDWFGLIGSVLTGLALVWVMLIGSSFFIRRSYESIASRLDDSMFRWAGLLFLVGAATTIVLVGFAVLFVAQVLLVVAFFSLDVTKV
jgi:uncharacterized membrane protein